MIPSHFVPMYQTSKYQIAALDNRDFRVPHTLSHVTPQFPYPYARPRPVPFQGRPVLQISDVPSNGGPLSASAGVDAGTCGLSGCGASDGKLFKILDPRFNIREALKNFLLLEDHLNAAGKRCQDCIIKHSVLCESFLEEGISLCTDPEHEPHLSVLEDTGSKFREIFRWMQLDKPMSAEQCRSAAQAIRRLRKPLMPYL